MKKGSKFGLRVGILVFLSCGIGACSQGKKEEKTLAVNTGTEKAQTEGTTPKKPLSQEFKDYWYAGDAEITSYQLQQARYGELREGKAVLIYVTEPFLPDVQVKADGNNPTNIPVLKLNKTKKYLTGIYPYSIMSSTFYPVHDNQHALKSSLSVQEWCGHVYAQLNNREAFEFTSHSYFEGEADQNLSMDKAILENEIWNRIRINPQDLPVGKIEIIPALEYFRVQHNPIRAYTATASISTINGISSYSIVYENTERKLTIDFSATFPYEIESWEESFTSGYGPNAKTMVSKGSKLKTLKTPYWGQNSNKYLHLRDSLAL
ncbi:septum formation inhibitor Maf [Muricauda sp. SCSIO 64092]|uniref:septum formation inhibitor Maf n=1 Tax=Allomuricauda sp. SCSIO 64092 TaxID=2908842 RepID=UPI001FF6EF7E|nr:septum formation inhibitor Maf [Muricauda sp. SCSIO 64092]UOY06235.1 septum formation inhibitor Maf [Muricauda sp. SCSIO 64092]